MSSALRALAAACALALAAPALAASSAPGRDVTPEAKAAGERAFAAAVQAYREARYAEAIEQFKEAYRLLGDPAIVYNVGQAYEKLGDLSGALAAYRNYLYLAPQAKDRLTVEAMVKNLEARLAEKGVAQVTVRSTPEGAAVAIDGKPVGTTPWTGELAPGPHEAVLEGGGRRARRTLDVPTDRSLEVLVALGEEGAPTAATDPAPPEGPTLRPATYAVLGGGAALLGSAVVVELLRQGAEDDAVGATTQVEYGERFETMESRQAVARVLAGLGSAAVIVGGVMLGLDLADPPAAGAGGAP